MVGEQLLAEEMYVCVYECVPLGEAAPLHAGVRCGV